jgi:antitoxin ParD1/3/4
MATMNVSLPDTMKQWVEKQSLDGRYSNSSDYMRDLIRKDQIRQDALVVLQQAVSDGVNSGQTRPFDAAQFKLAMREKHLVR